jgi:Cu+-exporting ATPase
MIALSVALGIALGACGRSETGSHAAPQRVVALEIGGMVCPACVAKVEKQLSSVPGVRRVRVSLDEQRADVLCEATVSDSSLTRAVRRAGSDFVGLVVDQ